MALERLKGKVRYQPIGFELLPPRFTLTQLQHLYETILERTLDKRNFRRKALAMGFLEETDEIEQDVAHRAARLYRFNETKYRKLVKQGFLFSLSEFTCRGWSRRSLCRHGQGRCDVSPITRSSPGGE